MSPPTSTLFAATLTAVQCFESGAFVVGANLPWILYGLDFGANRWRPNGGVAQGDLREPLNRKLAQLAAAGVTMVRWFLLCDGRAGIRFSDNGSPDGLDACVLPDIDAALDATNGHGLRVLFVLLDFHWCKSVQWVNGVQLGAAGRYSNGKSHGRDSSTESFGRFWSAIAQMNGSVRGK